MAIKNFFIVKRFFELIYNKKKFHKLNFKTNYF